MSHRFRLVSLFSLVLFASAGLPISASGQAVDVAAETEPPDATDRPFVFQTGYDHVFQSDLNGPGDVSIDSFQAQIGGRFDLNEQFSISTRFIYNLDAYDISDDAQPIDWGNINQYTLIGLLNWKAAEHWTVIGGPVLRLAGEGSAAFDDGFTGGAIVGFNYVADKDLSIGFGIGVVSQIEESVGIVPIPMLNWHFVEPLTLRAGVSQLGGRNGLGPELTWHVAKEVDLGLGMQYQRRRFRLDDHGFNRKGVGEDTSLPVYLRLGWRPIEAGLVEVFAGVVAGGELRVEDRDGNHGYDKGYEATPTIGIRGQYKF